MKYLSQKEAVLQLREEFSEWINELSEKEKIAIQKYSYNSMDNKPNRFFERLNSMLRGSYNKPDKELLQNYADIISKAICKHSLSCSIICYRGVTVDTTSDFVIGTEFSFRQFISTTVIKNKVFRTPYIYIMYVPKGTKGAYIEQLSRFPKQREFLLDRSCRYKLLSRKGNVIKLEVIS